MKLSTVYEFLSGNEAITITKGLTMKLSIAKVTKKFIDADARRLL